jgi:hypothetical protein
VACSRVNFALLCYVTCLLCIDFKKAYVSVRREVLYKIRIDFGIPRKLVRFIKMSLGETYSRVRVGKNVSDRFPIRNGLKQGDVLVTNAFQLCSTPLGGFR